MRIRTTTTTTTIKILHAIMIKILMIVTTLEVHDVPCTQTV